jgi:hypothetical protein
MPEADTICPFCNSRIAGPVDRAKPICPRCEAPLPQALVDNLSRRQEQTAITATPLANNLPTSNGGTKIAVEMPAIPGKKKTITVIFGIMAMMALLTAGYALWTKDFRRQNDIKKGFVPIEPISQSPEEIATLGLLPPECNLLAVVNVADLRKNPVAKKAFFDEPPRSIVWLADQLNEATGLTLDDLDHVAVGALMADKLPKIFVIVQTRTAYDPQRMLKAFAPAKPVSLRDRPVVRFPLWHVAEGMAWGMSERHIAFSFAAGLGQLKDLEAIPPRPRPKLDGFSDAVQALVKERVDKQSLAWLAVDLVPAAGLIDALSVLGARVEPLQPILGSKALTVSFKTDADFVVLGQILPRSAKEAEALAEKLRDIDWRGEASKKIELTPLEAKAEPWVTLQLRYEPAKVRELLERGPGFQK